MTRKPLLVLALTFVPAALIACGASPQENVSDDPSGITMGNGRESNGRESNGRESNGRESNGRTTGVWYAKRAGARIMDPLTNGRTRTLGGGRVLGAEIAVAGTLNPLSNVLLENGQLVGVRSNGARVTGTSFKEIYLVGRGPTPPLSNNAVLGRAGVVAGIAGNLVAVDPAAPVASLTPEQKRAAAIRAFVDRKRVETDRPERDVELRVKAAYPGGTGGDFHAGMTGSRWHYLVEVKEADGQWRTFCGPDKNGVERLAIAIPNKFNYKQGYDVTTRRTDRRVSPPVTTITRERGGQYEVDDGAFTFACDGAVIAKCVERLGYDPQKTIDQVKEGVADYSRGKPASDLLESCVRMFRADYCGNGLSMTLDGTEIDIYDSSQVQTPSSTTNAWPMEASWRKDGATCGQKQRQACAPSDDGTLVRIDVKAYIDTICPSSMETISESDDKWCEATHYYPGFHPQGGVGWPGGVGTPGGGLPGGGGVHPAAQTGGGGSGPTTFNEWNVIWTKTQFTHTNGCANARDLSAVVVGNGTLASP